MECPICGHELGTNDAFCPVCGNFSLPMQDHLHGEMPSGASDEALSEDAAPPTGKPEAEFSKAPRKVAERLYPPSDASAEDPLISLLDLQAESMNSEEDEGQPQVESESSEPERATASAKKHEPDVKAGKGRSSAYSSKSIKRVNRRLKILATVACVLALISIAFALYTIINTTSLRVQLSKAQKESANALANSKALQEQITTLTKERDQAKSSSTALSKQISDLQDEINGMEASVNQNQYDKETALAKLEEAKTQLEAVTEENTALKSELDETKTTLETVQSENETLSSDNAELAEKVSDMTTEISFYDSYVVFVMTDSGDKYYHKYDCPNFVHRNFLAYSTKLAEASGYSPCPVCSGGTSITINPNTNNG